MNENSHTSQTQTEQCSATFAEHLNFQMCWWIISFMWRESQEFVAGEKKDHVSAGSTSIRQSMVVSFHLFEMRSCLLMAQIRWPMAHFLISTLCVEFLMAMKHEISKECFQNVTKMNFFNWHTWQIWT